MPGSSQTSSATSQAPDVEPVVGNLHRLGPPGVTEPGVGGRPVEEGSLGLAVQASGVWAGPLGDGASTASGYQTEAASVG
jgi:hypothetical protein